MSTSTPFVTLTENTGVSKSKSSFAPYVPVPLVLRILSILRTVWIMLVVENPLLWALRQGRNRRADFEGTPLFVPKYTNIQYVEDEILGPYFTLGAPNRQYGVNEGKAVLASPRELRGRHLFMIVYFCHLKHSLCVAGRLPAFPCPHLYPHTQRRTRPVCALPVVASQHKWRIRPYVVRAPRNIRS